MRARDGVTLEDYTNSNSEWRYPKRTYHLHLGWYRNTMRQLTIIVDGTEYDYSKTYDELGERLGSGTLKEMQELLDVYKQML